MAVTITYDVKLNTNKSIGSSVARGKKMAYGRMNFSGLTALSATGITCDMTGFSTVDLVIFDQASGYQVNFNYSTEKIEIREIPSGTTTIAGQMQFLASGQALGSWTSVRFFAVGD
jgi:hypothetical protein